MDHFISLLLGLLVGLAYIAFLYGLWWFTYRRKRK